MSATAGPRHAGATLAIDLGAIRSKLPPAPPLRPLPQLGVTACAAVVKADALSNRATAFAGDTAVPLVGIVSMDTATFDVTDAPQAVEGGFLELIGPRHPVDALAGRGRHHRLRNPHLSRRPLRPQLCRHQIERLTRMKIVILGSGVIGVTSAWYLAAGRPRGHGPRPPAGPGAGDELRQRRRGLARLRLALGGARHPGEGAEVAVHAAQPAVHPPEPRPGLRALRLRDAAELHRGRLRGEQEPDGADRRIQPRHAEGAARRDRHRLRRAQRRARCSSSAPRSCSTARPRTSTVLADLGVPHEVLDPDGCIRAEPALARVREKFVGGLRLPGDETGDCFKFTGALARPRRRARRRLPLRRRRSPASSPTATASPASRPTTGTSPATPTSLALGSHSPLLLRPHGIDLPVYPVKGYSLTVPITDPAGAPESTVMDENHKVAITRLGDRIRVGGMAELDGYSTALHPRRRATLEHVVTDLYPAGGDAKAGSFWSGLRPMTPDGPPVIGRAKFAQPLAQHRPRHARLDHGLRLRPRARRPRLRPPAGDRREPLGLDRYATTRTTRQTLTHAVRP